MKKQAESNPVQKNMNGVPELEGTPELAPDLVWLLGNGRAETETLGSALLHMYGKPLEALARAYLDEEKTADQTVSEIIVQILVEARHFGAKLELDAWIYRLAVKNLSKARKGREIQRLLRKGQRGFASAKPQDDLEAALWSGFDELGGQPRMAFLLRALFGWEITEIASVMDEEPGRIQRYIEKAEKHLLRLAHQSGIASQSLQIDDLPTYLAEALNRRWQAVFTQLPELETRLPGMLKEVEQRKRTRKQASRIRLGAMLGLPLALILVVMLATRWSDPSVKLQELINPPTPVPTMEPRMHYTVSEGDRLEEIAALLQVPTDRLKVMNALEDAPPRPGKDLLIPIQEEAWQGPSPTPLPKNTLPPRPLSDRSTVQEVLSRMRASGSLWHTAWMDLYYLIFGPAGYAGPPQGNHIQLWISQPDKLLTITGDPTSNDTDGQLVRDGLAFDFFYPIIQVRRTNQGEGGPFTGYWFNIRDDGSFDNPEAWKVVGVASLAGRKTVLAEWDPKELNYPAWEAVFLRFWIDATTGTTLREQVFVKGDHPALYMDIITLKALFDIDLPASIFDPFRAAKMGFAKDYLGTPAEPKYLEAQMDQINQLTNVPEHERHKRKDPPEGFDPSQVRITFQYAKAINPISAASQPVALFADEYFLTELPYFNPLNARCTRSADGGKIAYSSPDVEYENSAQSHGGWIDLTHPEQRHNFTANQPINEMAFSPDGRYLAYTETDYSLYGNIYILDTESGETRELNRFETVYSLAWSPDGQALALITTENEAYQALVLNVKTGEITYAVHVKAFYAWDEADKPADWPARDWPGHAWGIKYPVTTRGLEGCYLP